MPPRAHGRRVGEVIQDNTPEERREEARWLNQEDADDLIFRWTRHDLQWTASPPRKRI